MAKLTITIKLDNEAFGDMPEFEVKRILRDFAERSAPYNWDGYTLIDVNGNRVGEVTYDDN